MFVRSDEFSVIFNKVWFGGVKSVSVKFNKVKSVLGR